jgi:catechol 2,3-dioxygenase-like lactoylglutathione lyase family enzyme
MRKFNRQAKAMNVLEFRFAFFARDFQKSVDFYRNMLDLEPIGGWDRQDGKGALLSAGGTAVIEIYGAADGKTYEGPSPMALNLALRVENAKAVDKFHERLSGLGAEKIEKPQDRPWGHRSFIILDPDQIPIHIYCELK